QSKELQGLLRVMDGEAKRNDIRHYYPNNLRFHDLLVAYAGNGRLAEIYGRITRELHLFRLQGLSTSGAISSTAEHWKILNAINFGNPILASRDPGGEPRGVSVDLAREAGRRLDLPIDLILFDSAGTVVEAVKARQVDLAFVAIDPVRAADMEYTAPYVIIEG